jgi:hypothetical protein
MISSYCSASEAGTSKYLESPPSDEQNESFSPSEFEDAVEDSDDLEKVCALNVVCKRAFTRL